MEATSKDITVAAVDLGSNSFRLLIARIIDKRVLPLFKSLVAVRLGQGLSSSDLLNQPAFERALSALNGFKKEMARYDVVICRSCGTEALRNATNADSFLAEATDLLGIEVEILPGEKEASLCFKGVMQSLEEPPPHPLMVIDVGGNSTELIFQKGPGSPLLTTSIKTGAVVFKELLEKKGVNQLRSWLSDQVKDFIEPIAQLPCKQLSVVATGGTATSLASQELKLKVYNEEKVHGHQLDQKSLNRLAEELQALEPEELETLPGIDEGRGRILPAGLEIYQEILATIGVDCMIVSDAGLLEGIALSCLDRATSHLPDPAQQHTGEN